MFGTKLSTFGGMMAGTRRKPFQVPPQSTRIKPLQNLEQVRPKYFFTPDLERAINQLDGVISARVLTTGTEIDEIHVLAPLDRTPKKIVRNIESLLLVTFGIRVDHRRISVVQTERKQTAEPMVARLRIEAIENLTPPDHRHGVRVRVRAAETIITGMGYAREDESELHSSSRAVISAIEQMLNTAGVLALDHLQVLELRDRKVVIVIVNWLFSGQEELLAGASVARDDLVEAAARATLDAMNRKLVRMQPAESAAS